MARRALPLLLVAFLALFAAGCGAPGAQKAGSGTDPADLAADAWQAFQDAGSLHYAVDVEVRAHGSAQEGPFGLRAEGDASEEALTVDASVTFPGGTFAGKLLAGPHEFFVNFLGTWYGTTEMGLVDAAKEAAEDTSEEGELWRTLQTPDGIRAFFPQIFTGNTSAGSDLDGEATWQFEGTFNVEGISALQERYGGAPMDAQEREMLQKVADALRVTMRYEQGSHRLRSVEFHADIPAEDLGSGDPFDDAERVELNAAVTFSDYGKDVSFDAPENFKPLEEAFEGLFGGFE